MRIGNIFPTTAPKHNDKTTRSVEDFYIPTPNKSTTKTTTSTSPSNIRLIMPKENTLYSSGTPDGYAYLLSYAENSTEENPIILVEGLDPKDNPFKFPININDINPYNATEIEMKALAIHTGKLKDLKDMATALPLDRERTGFNERTNFIASFNKNINDQKLLKNHGTASALANNMNFYLDFYASKNNNTSKNSFFPF